LIDHRLGMDNGCFLSKADNPAEEDGGNGNTGGENKVFFTVGNQQYVPAKPINDHIDETPVKPHFYVYRIAGIHLKQPVRVINQVFAGQFGAGDPDLVQKGDVGHAVYPVGCDTMTGRKGQQVTVLIILTQTVGACCVFFITVFPTSVQIPVEISEGNLPVLSDGLLDGIHIVVDSLVHAFDPAGNQHVPADQFCFVDTAFSAVINFIAGLIG